MEMHLTHVLFTCLILAWNSSALPCGGWSAGETHDVGSVTCPEEVIVLTISEGSDDDAGTLEHFRQPPRIFTDELNSSDHSLSGEVVESVDNGDEGSPIPVQYSDPLPTENPGVAQKSECKKSADDVEAVTTRDVKE